MVGATHSIRRDAGEKAGRLSEFAGGLSRGQS
jgi:hypothetical protein